jgi:hypothetical protein
VPNVISDLEGVSDQQADKIWQYNKQWFKENDIPIAIQQSGMVSGVNGASMPQGGRPNDLEKENKDNAR